VRHGINESHLKREQPPEDKLVQRCDYAYRAIQSAEDSSLGSGGHISTHPPTQVPRTGYLFARLGTQGMHFDAGKCVDVRTDVKFCL
jgi:hypothetical protein